MLYTFPVNRKVEPDDPLVLLTAPTGSAAFQIAGLTIHAALQLNSNSVSMSYENKAVLFQKLQQLKVMVTDEISMVGNERFHDMSLHLCKILHGDIWKNDFGGISVLVVCDLYQLPPVMQCPIYQQTVIREPGDMAPLLWNTFMLHELKQIMHQKDPEFSKMLNVVRVKQPEENSIEDLMLRSLELSIDALHPEYPKSAMHVFATNADAALWNNKMLENIEGEMYSYIADDSRKDQLANRANVVFSDKPHETSNLLKVLNIKIGAHVMLTNNIDVTDGLTNGAMGTVTKVIKKDNAQEGKQSHCVLLKFDSNTVGRHAIANGGYQHLCDKSVPIKKIPVDLSCEWKRKFSGITVSISFVSCLGSYNIQASRYYTTRNC